MLLLKIRVHALSEEKFITILSVKPKLILCDLQCFGRKAHNKKTPSRLKNGLLSQFIKYHFTQVALLRPSIKSMILASLA
jgi:hypothetical protein